MRVRRFFAGNLVDERCSEQRIEAELRCATVSAALKPAIGFTPVAGFLSVMEREWGFAHVRHFCISHAKRAFTA